MRIFRGEFYRNDAFGVVNLNMVLNIIHRLHLLTTQTFPLSDRMYLQ